MMSDIDGLKKLCRPSSDDETEQVFVNETDLTDYELTHLTRLLLDAKENGPYQPASSWKIAHRGQSQNPSIADLLSCKLSARRLNTLPPTSRRKPSAPPES